MINNSHKSEYAFSFKYCVVYIFLVISFPCISQNQIAIGSGLGVDIGLQTDNTDDYVLKRNNSASINLNLHSRISLKHNYYVYPFFIFTAINFNHNVENLQGSYMPEGDLLSLNNNGNIASEEYLFKYLYDISKGKTAHYSVGAIVSNELFRNFEIGGGVFYITRRTKIKDYYATDTYDYYGAVGYHNSNVQTDEYQYLDTEVDNKAFSTTKIVNHQVSIPLMLKYNINIGSGLVFSPAIISFIGQDIFHTINLIVEVNLFNKRDVAEEY